MRVSYRKLWKLIIDNGISKTELRERTAIGKATFTKLNKDENVSMDVLMKICMALKCDIGDIAEFIEGE
ncbi:MAG: helix-turn-helix transcriptional regulator [Rikenellaceae bacterium]